MNQLTTQEQQRQQHQERCHRCRDCSTECLVNRIIHDLERIVGPHDPKILANPIRDNNLVVQRITNHSENRCQDGQIEIKTKEREDTQNDQYIVNQSNDRTYRELELEAERDV